MGVNYLVFVVALTAAYHAADSSHRERHPFTWKNCGDSTDPVKIGDLTVYQNGSNYVYATGSFKTAFDVLSPIQGKLVMQKNVLGLWVPIPCVDNVGTCTYDDVCALSPYKIDCPQNYTDINLPCRCPILQGKYVFDALPINVNVLPKWIEKGLYYIKISLSQRGKRLLCVKMIIDL